MRAGIRFIRARWSRCGGVIAYACVLLTLAACVTETQGTARGRLFGTDQISQGNRSIDISRPETFLEENPRIVTTNSRLQTRLTPIGEIEYDTQSYPLVSPNGRFLASETGIRPNVETITAQIDATVPSATTITVYEIVPPAATDSAPHIDQRYILDESWVLGRSCNEQGFLIEAPQPDRSRWLGFVGWEDGEVIWIARDNRVNAFGALGPAGRMAWSRRHIDSPHFELVMFDHGATFTLGEELESWIYPVFVADGSGLFCTRLDRENTLTEVYLSGTTREAMRQSKHQITLSKNGSFSLAYSMMAAYPAIVDLPPHRQPTLLFDHPELRGVGVWRPLHTGDGPATLMDQGSTAGAMHDGFILFSRRGQLIGQPLEDPDARIVVDQTPYLPRLVTASQWDYLLMTPVPNSPRRLSVVGLNFLDTE